MKNTFLLILIFGLFAACKTDTNSSENGNNTEVLNSDPEQTVDPETLSLLDEVKRNPTDNEGNAAKLNKVALAFLDAKKTRQAVSLLKQAIQDHYPASKTADNAFDLMNIYADKYGTTNNAQIMAQSLKRAFPSYSKMKEVDAKIPAGTASLEKIIEEIRKNMSNKDTGRLEIKEANKFIVYSEIYALMLPQEAEAPNLLQKSGEVARSIRAYPKSIELYDWILSKFGDSKYAAQALFMKAFTYDNEMNDKKKARAFYEEFLQKFPNDGFADDTKFLLENIDKSNEEIIQSFNKNKGK